MNHLAVAVIVLEKSSDKPIVLGQSSRTGQSNGKTRYTLRADGGFVHTKLLKTMSNVLAF
jgi:hypothetical protein